MLGAHTTGDWPGVIRWPWFAHLHTPLQTSHQSPSLLPFHCAPITLAPSLFQHPPLLLALLPQSLCTCCSLSWKHLFQVSLPAETEPSLHPASSPFLLFSLSCMNHHLLSLQDPSPTQIHLCIDLVTCRMSAVPNYSSRKAGAGLSRSSCVPHA